MLIVMVDFVLNDVSGVELWRPFLLGQVVHICLIVLALLRDDVACFLILLLIVVLKVVLVFLGNDPLEVQLGVIEVILIMEVARVDSILILIFVVVFSFLNNGVHVGVSRALLFLVNIVQRRVKFFLWYWYRYLYLRLVYILSRHRVLSNYLELFNDVNSDGAQVTTNQGHATFLIARDKQGAASTEAVAIMFTGHSIAAIYRAKHVARKLGDGFHFRLLLCFSKSF